MNVRQINRETLEAALAETNERYDGNLEFVYCERDGSGYAFRIRAKDSHGAGGRFNLADTKSGRRYVGVAACWHAHGYLFEAILERSPESWITTAMARIDRYRGNWQDRNIGSMMQPLYYSEACECDEREI